MFFMNYFSNEKYTSYLDFTKQCFNPKDGMVTLSNSTNGIQILVPGNIPLPDTIDEFRDLVFPKEDMKNYKTKEPQKKQENEKTLFVVNDFVADDDEATFVKLSDEQAKAISWFINRFSLEIGICPVDDSKIEEI